MLDPRLMNPGETINIGSPDWLTQVQHKGDRVDIVDHADHFGAPVHIFTRIDRHGNVDTEYE